MTKKEQYISFCERHDLPIQMQPWWLDAVCSADRWDVCLAFNKQGEVVGALPYFLFKKMGLTRVTMPPMTDYIGPWIIFPKEKHLKKVSLYNIETNILNDLIEQLPDSHLFFQTYLPELQNGLPFYWNGFNHTTYYTYRLPSPINAEKAFDEFKYTVRTEIRKAVKRVAVERVDKPEQFFRIHTKSFNRKGLDPMIDEEKFLSIDKQIKAKSRRQIILARDKGSGDVHAGLYLVQDNSMIYILLTGIDPVLKSSGALYLLYWDVIQLAEEQGLGVDFCGSIIPGVEASIRSLGGDRIAYLSVSRTKNRILRILSLLLNKEY